MVNSSSFKILRLLPSTWHWISKLLFGTMPWGLNHRLQMPIQSQDFELWWLKQKSILVLWDRIPPAYNKALVFTDYWKAYPSVIPPEQHRPVGKETGETAHTERWNNTLHQHLDRFVHKTLSFSKCIHWHEICLKLFLHRYNTELLLSVG